MIDDYSKSNKPEPPEEKPIPEQVEELKPLKLRVSRGPKPAELLTPTEFEVIRAYRLVGTKVNRIGRVAIELGIAKSTVNKHLEHAREKLNVTSTPELIRVLKDMGIITK